MAQKTGWWTWSLTCSRICSRRAWRERVGERAREHDRGRRARDHLRECVHEHVGEHVRELVGVHVGAHVGGLARVHYSEQHVGEDVRGVRNHLWLKGRGRRLWSRPLRPARHALQAGPKTRARASNPPFFISAILFVPPSFD